MNKAGTSKAGTAKLLDRYRVTNGSGFRLKDHDPADRGGHHVDYDRIDALLADGVARLSELQASLYADDQWSMLAVLQAMDAAGKDGTIKHVMTGVNPQGVQVTSFKQPGPLELSHGFLWRVHPHAPARGGRVHPEMIDALHLPAPVRGKKFWRHRLEDIANFESYLARQGTIVLKFFLHLSKAEQRNRFLARIEHPAKNWKFNTGDLKERTYWDAYQDAYENAIAATAAEHAPWFVVPADDKKLSHLIVAEAMIEALTACRFKTPEPTAETLAQMQQAAEVLRAE